MKGKKVLGIFVLMFLILSPLIASAQYYGYSRFYGGVDTTFSWIENNVGPAFGYVLGGTGDLLFERILLFFVLLALVFIILSRMKLFKENYAVIWIITLAVSLLATRFLSDYSLVQNVLLPYSILGVALTAAIPFIIYFFFVQSFEDSSTLRKILWVFFIVVFLGLWGDRQSELGQLSYIYILTGLVALVCLLADGTIRRALWRDRMKQQGYNQKQDFVRGIRRQLADLEKDKKDGVVGDDYYYKMKRDLNKQMKSLYKN